MAGSYNGIAYGNRFICIDLTHLAETHAGDSGKKSGRSNATGYLPAGKQRLFLDHPCGYCIRLLCRMVVNQTFAESNIPDQQWHCNIHYGYLCCDDDLDRIIYDGNKNLAGNENEDG